MPRLSIVIPCLGGAADFDGTLVSVLQHRPLDCEVLVVHAQPYGDPYGLAGEVTFLHEGGRDLVGLLNAGIERASGEVIHTLASGLEATEGWTEAPLAQFDDPDVLSVAPVVLSADGQKVTAAGVRWSLGGARRVAADRRLLSPGAGRLRARIVGPTLAAGFYRRDALAALDGFDCSLGDALADVDVALALRMLGGLNVCEPASRLLQVGPQPWPNTPAGFTRGRSAERLFWRYASQRGTALSMAAHCCSVVVELLGNLPKAAALTALVGRGVATVELGAGQRHARRLALAAQRLSELAQLRATVRLPARESTAPSATPRNHRRRAA